MCNEGNENIWEIKYNSLKLYEPKESRNVICPEKEIKNHRHEIIKPTMIIE